MSKQRVSLLVLGMHRGGTSTIARALRALGVPLGDQLLPPTDANPRGYWEDVEVVAINEELLRHFHSAWDRLELVHGTLPSPILRLVLCRRRPRTLYAGECRLTKASGDLRIREQPGWYVSGNR